MELTSRRLEYRPFEASDARELLALFRNPEVRRFLLDGVRVSEAWVRDEIDASAERFADSGAGLWSIRRPGNARILGFVGFREFFEPARLQLVYALHPDWWGRGLATEAARRICHHAFRELGFMEVEAATDEPNERSIGVLHRLGMSLRAVTDDGWEGTRLYVLEDQGAIP